MNGAILEIVGDANGSENAFINCRAIIFGHVIDCLNPQAVNHLSLFCHWEVILGDMFRFIRGGNLTLLGGSIILSNFGHAPEWKPQTAYLPNAIFYFDGRRFRTSKGGISGNRKIEGIVPVHFDGAIEWDLEGDDSAYVLRVGGDLTGQINSYLISGARIELRSNKAKLLGGGDLNTRALVTFDGVAVQPVVGGARHTIELAESSTSIHFSNCKLARASSIWEEPFSVLFGRGPSALNRRDGARILLDGCVVSEHIHDLSVWGENSMAAITLQNCVVGYQEARTLPGQSYTRIVDGTVMGVSRAKSSNTSRSGKHLQVFFQYWPGSLPEDSIHICLPPQAMLLRVHFVKLGTSTSTSKYELFLRDGEGNELFRSDLVNLAGPFEIETPRLFVRSPSGGLLLSIQGSDYKRPATKAGPSDCIILDWMA
ncbi:MULTISPECIES: hypothetical protein [Bradyrhizobium]|uniref:hypothetical protein n=1 Tax=Bradyrhizobium TaxID=374 RepID=UPI001E334A54|nr:hypothetical protein [Bradyrhizobium canariense]MBM7488390.1 hypothetical protein [Bradyrhizobium canariense]UFW71065.1 hypothetical protein BcanWU425_30865 [Bradyrhizobium canariense]